MPQELTDEEKDARRARVSASNRTLDRVLSVAGVILATVSLALLIGGGVVMSALDHALTVGANRSDLVPVAGITATAMTAAPGVILLFAMCALPAERARGKARLASGVANNERQSLRRGLPQTGR